MALIASSIIYTVSEDEETLSMSDDEETLSVSEEIHVPDTMNIYEEKMVKDGGSARLMSLRPLPFKTTEVMMLDYRKAIDRSRIYRMGKLIANDNNLCEDSNLLTRDTQLDAFTSPIDYLFVAIEQGEILGFARVRIFGNAWIIDTLCSKGKGQRLMEEMISKAREKGISKIMLESVPTAVTFYRRFGFKHIGESGAEIEQAAQQIANIGRVYDYDFMTNPLLINYFRIVLENNWSTTILGNDLVTKILNSLYPMEILFD